MGVKGKVWPGLDRCRNGNRVGAGEGSGCCLDEHEVIGGGG